MLPGYLNGTYSESEVTVDVEALVERVGGRLVLGRAVLLDRSERSVNLADGTRLPYELVSFNLGSGLAGRDLPGVREHAVLIKPFSRVPELRRMLESPAETGAPPSTVVGAGAAGVEIACTMAAHSGVRLVEGSGRILAEYGEEFRRRATRVLADKGIEVATGARVAAVETGALVLEDGSRLRSGATIWLAGASAPPLFKHSGLTTDDRGFLLVDDTLRYVADERIFAVGDCAALLQYPETPKAGVYSVRQGPVVWQGLMAAIHDRKAPRYRPQDGFLSLLNTADGRALIRYKGLVGHNRFAWWLKDWIDKRFLRRYQT